MNDAPKKPSRVALFRARHPHLSRAIRNTVLTGAVTGALAMGAKRNFRHAVELAPNAAARLQNKAAIKMAFRRGKTFQKAAIATGGLGIIGGVGNPLERWDYERRERQAAGKRPVHRTMVVQRRRGAPTVHRSIYS